VTRHWQGENFPFPEPETSGNPHSGSDSAHCYKSRPFKERAGFIWRNVSQTMIWHCDKYRAKSGADADSVSGVAKRLE
jgi:hypothetical protein